MRYSRVGIVVVLVAVEVLLAGAILGSLHQPGWFLHPALALRNQSQAKDFTPIDAGTAPTVTVDDGDASLTVTASSDGLVHVTHQEATSGWVLGNRGLDPVRVTRTAQGVAVTGGRPGVTIWGVFDSSSDRITLSIPPSSTLEVTSSSDADVQGLNGPVSVATDDGSIRLSGIRSPNVTLASDDGDIHLDNVQADQLSAHSDDGEIRGSALQIGGGSVATDDGDIQLALGASNLAVTVKTSDGDISYNGKSADSGSRFLIGTASGALQLNTDDGDIQITSNGAN